MKLIIFSLVLIGVCFASVSAQAQIRTLEKRGIYRPFEAKPNSPRLRNDLTDLDPNSSEIGRIPVDADSVNAPIIRTAITAVGASSTSKDQRRDWSNVEVFLSGGVLVFGTITLGLQTWIISKVRGTWPAEAVLKTYALTLIITGALLLIAAGYSSEQIAPVMGLLGTLGGYLLGTASQKLNDPQHVIETGPLAPAPAQPSPAPGT